MLAAVAYAAGPDRFIALAFNLPEHLARAADALLHRLTFATFDLIRALAIGLFAIFLALSAMAISRGQKGAVAVVVVSVLFLLLVREPGYAGATRWLGALLLAACGAGVMTQRLARSGR